MNKQDLIKTTIIALAMSVMCSTATYFITARQIPKFATVDLLGLSNDFLINISKYQFSKGMSDDQVAAMVRNYSATIQPLLDDISKRGNVILFQKQAIVTESNDITAQVARVIFKDYLPNSTSSNSESNLNSNEYAPKENSFKQQKNTEENSNANETAIEE